MLARVIVGCVAAAACAAPAIASAAPVSGTETALQGLPYEGTPGTPARSVKSITSTFDSTSGIWTTTLTFYRAQAAATQAKLHLTLGESTQRPDDPSVGTEVWTDPSDPRPTTPSATSAGQPVVAATFSADLRSMTVTVADPALVGLPLNDLTFPQLSHNTIYDLFPSMILTPSGDAGPAPSVTLPSSDRSLRVRGNAISLKLGTVTHPSSIAAFVEVTGRIVARDAAGLGAGFPTSLPLGIIRGTRVATGRHAAKLIVMVYSPAGVSTTRTEKVVLTR